MNEGFARGFDPCHGYDYDPRSPYYKDKRRESGAVCALCEEPIYEGEEFLHDQTTGHSAHFECFKRADIADLLTFVGYHIEIA